MAIRIRFSEELSDQRALIAAGGKVVFPKGKPPQFGFDSQIKYQEYLKIRKVKTPTAATEDV